MFDLERKWPNKVEQTGSTLGLSEIRTTDTPPVHIIHRQGASCSASCRSNSFTILSPSPLLGVETPQQVQATSDRSRISTKACSPITCLTGCATIPAAGINGCCNLFFYLAHMIMVKAIGIQDLIFFPSIPRRQCRLYWLLICKERGNQSERYVYF